MTLGATTVYVTHDQIEAMTLSTGIVVMKEGIIQQVGSPQEVYHFPANLFVAEFMGNPSSNLIKATAQLSGDRISLQIAFQPSYNLLLEGQYPLSQGQELIINIRPEDVDLQTPPSDQHLKLKVYTSLPAGSEALTYLRTQNDHIEFVVKRPENLHRKLRPEMEVGLQFKKGNMYNAVNGALLGSFPHDFQQM